MVYLFYGEEKYELYKEVEKIKKSFDNLEVGVNFFNVTKDNLNILDSLYTSVNFFGTNKLVIIKDTNLKIDIKKFVKSVDNYDIYIFIEDSIDKRTSEYKELSKIANVVEFKYLNEKEMSKFIITTLKKYNIDIKQDVADYITEVCGTDKSNNINEMKKLVAYLPENSVVTKEIVDKVCSKTLNSKIFDMLDMAVLKKHDIAIKMFDDLIKQKEPAIKISIMLYKQIKQMYLIKLLKDDGENNINAILKLHPFVFSKMCKASENYTKEDLRKIIDNFYSYDQKTKIGQLDFEIGLKKIICML